MRKVIVVLATAALSATASLTFVQPAQAITIDNPNVVGTACTRFVYSYDGFAYDRNNLGTTPGGSESVTFRATDGMGNEIYSNAVSNRLLDSDIPGTDAVSLFTVAPVANPITFTITSHAGNGFDEEESMRIVNTCPTLPSPASVTPAAFSTDVGDAISADLAPFAVEPNGFPLTYSILSPPTAGIVELTADGAFNYRPASVGTVRFSVRVENEAGQFVELPVTVTVTGTDIPPKVTPTPTPTPPKRVETGTR